MLIYFDDPMRFLRLNRYLEDQRYVLGKDYTVTRKLCWTTEYNDDPGFPYTVELRSERLQSLGTYLRLRFG